MTEFLNCCTKLPTITTTPPGCGWGHASPEVIKIRCYELVNVGEVGQ